METNLSLVSHKPVLGSTILTHKTFGLPTNPTGSFSISKPRSKTLNFGFQNPKFSTKNAQNAKTNNGFKVFASASTSNGRNVQETTSVGNVPQPYASPPTQFGSPLFWIGVGVGFSALFSFVAARVKNYAMQQAFKTMMGQMGSQNNQFSNASFPPGSPFGFPPPSTSGVNSPTGFPYQSPSTTGQNTSTGYAYAPPSTTEPKTSSGSGFSMSDTSPSSAASKADATVDVSTTKSETKEPMVVKDDTTNKTGAKKSAFVDVSPEETLERNLFEDFNGSSSQMPSGDAKFAEVVQNGAASKEDTTSKDGKAGSVLSVEALEKMMEDPSVQKMIYPHLPEEMRNPTTFKWMLQNPVYRKQLQDMLDNMGGSGEWDKRMVETLQGFNFESPEVKQQFDDLGLTPEEVISKIMANPDVAMAFQNPRVQQAIMDCSQNPMNIAKYQHDEEVMSVFNKISQLFPGAAGPGGF